MHVIIMGPQGVGKGTQAVLVAERNQLVHVSTGDLFRAAIKAQTPLGLMAREILDRGDLVPDEITLGIVEKRLEELAEERAVRGALFDGFPRTPAQAEGLDAILLRRGEVIAAVIELTAPRSVLIERLTGRRVCPNCGKTYHIVFNPPATEGICDRCGHQIMQRPDDTLDAIERRLALYDQQTAPLLAYYRAQGLLHTVDGDRDVETVAVDMTKIIEKAASGRA